VRAQGSGAGHDVQVQTSFPDPPRRGETHCPGPSAVPSVWSTRGPETFAWTSCSRSQRLGLGVTAAPGRGNRLRSRKSSNLHISPRPAPTLLSSGHPRVHRSTEGTEACVAGSPVLSRRC
jgi:hypothetical protein